MRTGYATGGGGPQGISACTRVPRPSGLSSERVPSSAATRSARPRRPEPRCRVGAADAVVGDVRGSPARCSGWTVTGGMRRLRVLRRVGERLRHDEVRGALDRWLAGSRSEPWRSDRDRHRRAGHERLQRRLEALLGQHRRVDAAGQLAQLGEAGLQLRPARGRAGAASSASAARCDARGAAAGGRAPTSAAGRRRGGRARAAGARRHRLDERARDARNSSRWAAARRRGRETWLRAAPPGTRTASARSK